jgi:[pyruvate, water dikinase]-phosphate phosphotransferase / [pyruvate, water dikinase] kinase
VMDFFHLFIAPLEQELQAESNHAAGRSHGIANSHEYFARIEAVNFTLAHDDGASTKELDRAQVILVGVSRCGKTPTSLYLALQFGIRCANFPLTPDDFERGRLPESILPHRQKLYGLTIAPDRLQQIRHERRPNAKYSDPQNCRWETSQAESMMQRYGIMSFDTTVKSIEEIATTILMKANLARHVY